MKNLFFPALVMFAMTFASCSKTYNCTCVDGDGNQTSVTEFENDNLASQTACATASAAEALATGGSCSLEED